MNLYSPSWYVYHAMKNRSDSLLRQLFRRRWSATSIIESVSLIFLSPCSPTRSEKTKVEPSNSKGKERRRTPEPWEISQICRIMHLFLHRLRFISFSKHNHGHWLATSPNQPQDRHAERQTKLKSRPNNHHVHVHKKKTEHAHKRTN